MFRSALLGAIACLCLSGGAEAAVINFSVRDIDAEITSYTGDGYRNVELDNAQYNRGNRGVDFGSPETLNALAFEPRGPRDSQGDSFGILASIVLRIAGVNYTYIAEGLMTNWTVDDRGRYVTGVLTWLLQPKTPANNPLSVIFNSGLVRDRESGDMISTVTISRLAPSVVPLPAGVVMLLTALLGLAGLTRRRKTLAA